MMLIFLSFNNPIKMDLKRFLIGPCQYLSHNIVDLIEKSKIRRFKFSLLLAINETNLVRK
jgi:hypothetical protein